MSIVIKSWSEASCKIIAIEGVADADVMGMLGDGIASVADDARGLVLDLDGLLLTDLGAVRALLGGLVRRPVGDHVVVSCRRLTGRRILRRLGGGSLRITDDPRRALALAVADGQEPD